MSLKTLLGIAIIAAASVWVVQELGRREQAAQGPADEAHAAEERPLLEDLGGAVPLDVGAGDAIPIDIDESAPMPSEPSFADDLREAEALARQGRTEDAAMLLASARDAAASVADAARAALLLAPLTSDPAERRGLLSEALRERVVVGAEYEQVGDWLEEMNRNSGASLLPLLRTSAYEVKSGDSLWVLCNRVFPDQFGVRHEVGLVAAVNGLSGTSLRVGQRLLIPLDALSIRVDTGEHGLVAMLGDVAFCAYRVGLGKESRTPRGRFVVNVKQEDPPWYRNGEMVPFGHPDNVLGTRWMGFEDKPGSSGFGIHGTTEPDSIGKNESMGCVRMRNEEVEQLFLYVSRGCPVDLL